MEILIKSEIMKENKLKSLLTEANELVAIFTSISKRNKP